MSASRESILLSSCERPVRHLGALLVVLACAGCPASAPPDAEAFRMAAALGQLDQVSAGIAHDPAWVSDKATDGQTALHQAALMGRISVAALLLEKGANKDAPDSQGNTPLHKAAEAGHPDIIKLLLARGANAAAKNESGDTPLHAAAWTSDSNKSALEALIEGGAPVDAENSSGETALLRACVRGHGVIAGVLLERGANPNTSSREGRTPLDVSQDGGHSDLVAALKKAGAKEEQAPEPTPPPAPAPRGIPGGSGEEAPPPGEPAPGE